MDITTWTMLLTALTPLVIAAARQDAWSDNLVTIVTLVIVTAFFFAGKALDGGLAWPLPQTLAAELAQALIVNQVLFAVLKNTTPMRALRRIGAAK